jgi:hypothetical protein
VKNKDQTAVLIVSTKPTSRHTVIGMINMSKGNKSPVNLMRGGNYAKV